ncbi:MAG: DUF5668 domain-containing protein [Patescibacteria group bacterium]|nr:hypothetical protein [Patescibacteria group bacterium]
MPYGYNLYRGIVLLLLGILFLLGTMEVIPFAFTDYWPLILIMIGIEYLFFPKK